MLLQMSLFHSFLWLSNIPLHIWTTSFLSIHTFLHVAPKSLTPPKPPLGKDAPPKLSRFLPWKVLGGGHGTQFVSMLWNSLHFCKTVWHLNLHKSFASQMSNGRLNSSKQLAFQDGTESCFKTVAAFLPGPLISLGSLGARMDSQLWHALVCPWACF